MNRKEIEKHFKYLAEDRYNSEFYVALLLYDIVGIEMEKIDDEIIDYVYELQDEYDSIYNEDLRDRLHERFLSEKEIHENELEYEIEIIEKNIEKYKNTFLYIDFFCYNNIEGDVYENKNTILGFINYWIITFCLCVRSWNL